MYPLYASGRSLKGSAEDSSSPATVRCTGMERDLRSVEVCSACWWRRLALEGRGPGGAA